MTGPLAPLFAQLGGTLDFLREIENGTRCGQCQRPHATDEDWQRYDEGEGEHLCWETVCSHEPESPTALERITEALAALSSIERHVQDMTRWEKIAKDWRYSNEFLGGVVRQTWPAEYPRAALPAREKGTE